MKKIKLRKDAIYRLRSSYKELCETSFGFTPSYEFAKINKYKTREDYLEAVSSNNILDIYKDDYINTESMSLSYFEMAYEIDLLNTFKYQISKNKETK